MGQDDWTTLPDANGHTSQSTGPNDPDLASCPAGWRELHRGSTTTRRSTARGACTPHRHDRRWNAASGRSAGWEQWSIDLGAYAGKQVEISIAYARATGRYRDSARSSTTAAPDGCAATSFEDGLGGWTVAGPPAASRRTRTTSSARQAGLPGGGRDGTTPSTSGSASKGSTAGHPGRSDGPGDRPPGAVKGGAPSGSSAPPRGSTR